MKRRWIILISNVLSIMLILLCLSGCKGWEQSNKYADPWRLKKEENGFYYYVIGKDGYPEDKENIGTSATILGLVDSEQHREELVIPEKLGGYPVKHIGGSYSRIGSSPTYYNIDATNIDRIIINYKCKIEGGESIINFKGELVINTDVKFSFVVPPTEIIIFNIDLKYLTDYQEWSKIWERDWVKKQIVKFDSIGGEQKTYAIALNRDERLTQPEPPKKEGFDFGGWYIDEEYEAEWNFETDLVTENITLYAKWIEV